MPCRCLECRWASLCQRKSENPGIKRPACVPGREKNGKSGIESGGWIPGESGEMEKGFAFDGPNPSPQTCRMRSPLERSRRRREPCGRRAYPTGTQRCGTGTLPHSSPPRLPAIHLPHSSALQIPVLTSAVEGAAKCRHLPH